MDQWPVTAGKFALATHRTAPILAGMQTMGSVTTEAQEVPSIVHSVQTQTIVGLVGQPRPEGNLL